MKFQLIFLHRNITDRFPRNIFIKICDYPYKFITFVLIHERPAVLTEFTNS